MYDKIKNKIVFITGASKGLGLETAVVLSKMGAKVIISAQNTLDYYLEHKILSNDFLNTNNLHFMKCNVMMKEDFINVKSEIDNKFGNIDILINNAGVAEFTEFINLSEDSFNLQNEIMYKGTFLAIKTFLPDMLKKETSLIVNTLSVAVRDTFTNASAYAGAKAAVLAMSNSLREEVRSSGVKVFNFILGATLTNIWDEYMINNFADKMIPAKESAEVLAQNIFLNMNNRFMIEELVLKPQGGNL